MQRGFSLVELSIVLVILGLLTGGILAGQSLIRASQLRAVNTEFQRYLTAAHTFRDKYFSIPGDSATATRVWERQVNAAHCVTNSGNGVSATAGACDGNGNSTLELANAASEAAEIHQFWRHLALAGLVEGSYTGLAGSGGQLHMTSANAPPSKLNGAYWGVRYITPNYGGSGTMYAGTFGNYMQIGGLTSASANAGLVLKPEEAWNIDTKLDDGLPGTGKLVAYEWTACTDAGSQSDYTAGYDLDLTTVSCGLIFPRLM